MLRPDQLNNLLKRYAQPHRHYHSWPHIEVLLAWFERVKDQLHHREAVQLAIYYHDAIYQVPGPPKTSNEKASAVLLLNELSLTHEPEVLHFAAVMIEATEAHLIPEQLDPDQMNDCALFLDMDLSVLGAEPDIYDRYCEQIRAEYAVIPEELYRPGRAKILAGFLARDQLFFSDHFHLALENQARTNLTRELAALTAV